MAEGKAAFIGGVKSPSKTKLKAWSGDNPADDWYKVLAWGNNGSGKTFLEVGLLELGFKVFHLDTDFGGNGTRTVKEILKQRGKSELLKNFKGIDIGDLADGGLVKDTNRSVRGYKALGMWLDNPDIVEVADGVDIYAWDPEWIVWDGGSNFQTNILDEYILELDPFVGKERDGSPKEADARRAEGLRAEVADWDAIRRGTFRKFEQFLTSHNRVTGRRWSKLVTMVEQPPKDAQQAKSPDDLKPRPAIAGGAKNFFNGGFDLVLHTVTKLDLKQNLIYEYEINPGKSFTKNRALPVGSTEPGDPVALWRKITGRTV
jgi:hypothetical protein